MQQSAAVMELISGYDAYAEAGDLNVSAAADAPATSWYCVGASISLISATLDRGC